MLVQGGGGLLVSISSEVFNNYKQRMIINNDINWMMIICFLLFPKWMMTYTAIPIKIWFDDVVGHLSTFMVAHVSAYPGWSQLIKVEQVKMQSYSFFFLSFFG